MTGRSNGYRMLATSCILWSAILSAPHSLGQQPRPHSQTQPDTPLSALVQSAQSDYLAGRPSLAAAKLEAALPRTPNAGSVTLENKYFPAEELLGLCYAAMSQDPRAVPYLETAARLNPQSEEAHTNLAATLLRLGRTAQALDQFRAALVIAPGDYTANHNLGEFYIQAGKLAEAVPLLDKAQQLKPDAYDNGYDLATAYLVVGKYTPAHQVVHSLLQQKNTGELHDLDAQIDEKEGKFVDAANEFETAAHLDPSENNLFDWGSELLLHRTYDPAIEVFRAAATRYPQSPRIMIGLGISLYARGLYDQAVIALLAGADLDPTEPRSYLFLSKAYYSQQTHTQQVIEHFQRYAEQQPGNAQAQYYYAMSLWKGGQIADQPVDMQKVQSLLEKSIELDDKFSDAHFQLGNLYASRHDYQHSVPQYLRVTELDPNLADAHYRLGSDYNHIGEKDKAQAEFATYQTLRAQHLSASDKEGNELEQFVYTSKPPASNP
jgi:tetratricopeptide (TPR) repeat protein